jgi:uncharacterized membrane protein YcaP (DUF421 family)
MKQTTTFTAADDEMDRGRLPIARAMILEIVIVAVLGALVWGGVWELGYPSIGLASAAVIWLTLWPLMEIVTLRDYFRGRQ